MLVKIVIAAIVTIVLQFTILRGWLTVLEETKLLWTQLDGAEVQVICV